MQLDFANQFGALKLALVSEVRPVDSIFGADIDAAHKFDLHTAEQVALITENRRIQIGGLGAHDCYIVVHESPTNAAIARIESINYIGGNPAQEIERARQSPIL